MIVLWTDGSAAPNPGPGGYAVLEDGELRRLGRSDLTTNIRMEMSAVIAAMKYALEKKETCEIHTDSEICVKILTKWLPSWKRRAWVKSDGRPVDNLDLVKWLDQLYDASRVKLVWVRGHVGVEYNELADAWAKRAREKDNLPEGIKVNEVPPMPPKNKVQQKEKNEKGNCKI